MGDVKAWPLPAGRPVDQPPRRLKRPAEYGLEMAVTNLETQLGTIEAYNKLCEAAARLRRQIDAGRAKAQSPQYAVRPRG